MWEALSERRRTVLGQLVSPVGDGLPHSETSKLQGQCSALTAADEGPSALPHLER
jgi:hypothetical protein